MDRNKAIDLTKGLGILMITYGHITELSNPVDTWMSLFKISLFFILAGYLMRSRGNIEMRSTKESIMRTLRSIMIPYISFSAVSITVRAIAAFLKNQDVFANLYNNIWATLSLRGISTLWFLPVLALAEILFILMVKKKHKGLIVASLIWPIFFAVFAEHGLLILKELLDERAYKIVSYPLLFLSKSLISIWFLGSGYLICPLLQKLTTRKYRLSLGLVLSAVTIIIAVLAAPRIDFNMMRLGEPPLFFFLGGVTGTFGALLLFEQLESFSIMRPLEYFGKNSLILMVVQRAFLIINFLLSGWKATIGLPEIVCPKYYVETLCVLVLVLIMSYAFIEIINRSPVLSKVFLGKEKS